MHTYACVIVCENRHWALAYRTSKSGLSLYHQFFTTVEIYLLNTNFLQYNTVDSLLTGLNGTGCKPVKRNSG